MSLLTVRIPIEAGRTLDQGILCAVAEQDRPRVRAAARVRGLRVVSTEPTRHAPLLRSVTIAGKDDAARNDAPARIATLANQIRPDQPKLNVVDCGVPEGVTLGGGKDWKLHSSEPAPRVGAVLTFLVTLDD